MSGGVSDFAPCWSTLGGRFADRGTLMHPFGLPLLLQYTRSIGAAAAPAGGANAAKSRRQQIATVVLTMSTLSEWLSRHKR